MIVMGRFDFELYIEEYCFVCLRSGKGWIKFRINLDYFIRKWIFGFDKYGFVFGFKICKLFYIMWLFCWGCMILN